MDHFQHRDGELYAEHVPLARIADEVGTPVYVYSRATLERHARVFREALSGIGPVHLAYAVKANPNLAVLRVMRREGFGADVVSGGELARALAAGMAPRDIVFSGVGKQTHEFVQGLDADIGQFNLESEEEGAELAGIAAARGVRARCALRVNPDVDAGTHDKISTGKADNKFGVPIGRALAIYARLAALPGLEMRGLAVHIGSQLADLAPLEDAFAALGRLMADLRGAGHTVSHMDLGGGLGVPYKAADVLPSPAEYGAMVARVTRGWDATLMFEPGRVIAGNAGVLLTRVVRVKQGINDPFVIVDAAMNDLARPALYGAWHDFEAVRPSNRRMMANIVGPICETGDTFAMGRDIEGVDPGDLAVFRTAGAYGATMASSYNSRGFVPEVMVDGDRYAVVADRIAPEVIAASERVPDGSSEALPMKALPLFHRISGRPVIVVGEGAAAEARRRLVERAGAMVVGEGDAGARLAFVTGERPEPCAQRLKARGVLVNVADRPDLCDFTMPSLLDRDPVLVAIGTDGASAGLAKHVRLALERWLPADLGALATALEAARSAMRARWPDPTQRRRALDAALAAGGPLDPQSEGAAERVGRWLEDVGTDTGDGVRELKLASDDPDELTLRQARLLGTADAVLFEAGVAPAILNRARADALRLPLPHAGRLPRGLVLLLRRVPPATAAPAAD